MRKNMSNELGRGNELNQGLTYRNNNIRQWLVLTVQIMSHFYEWNLVRY